MGVGDLLLRLLKSLFNFSKGLQYLPSIFLSVRLVDENRKADLLVDFEQGKRATEIKVKADQLETLREELTEIVAQGAKEWNCPLLNYRVRFVYQSKVSTIDIVEALPPANQFDSFLLTCHRLLNEKQAEERHLSTHQILQQLENIYATIFNISFLKDSQKRLDFNFRALWAQQMTASLLTPSLRRDKIIDHSGFSLPQNNYDRGSKKHLRGGDDTGEPSESPWVQDTKFKTTSKKEQLREVNAFSVSSFSKNHQKKPV